MFHFPGMERIGLVGGGWHLVSGGDGWFLLAALDVGRHGVVGVGWCGEWRGVQGGDGLGEEVPVAHLAHARRATFGINYPDRSTATVTL